MFAARIVEEVIQCDGEGCNRWLKIECPSRCANPQKEANNAVRDKGWDVIGYGDKHLCRDCKSRLTSMDAYLEEKDKLIEESHLCDSPHDDVAIMEVEGGSVQSVAVSSDQAIKFFVVDRDIEAYDEEDLINVGDNDGFIYEIRPMGREETGVINEFVSLDIV